MQVKSRIYLIVFVQNIPDTTLKVTFGYVGRVSLQLDLWFLKQKCDKLNQRRTFIRLANFEFPWPQTTKSPSYCITALVKEFESVRKSNSSFTVIEIFVSSVRKIFRDKKSQTVKINYLIYLFIYLFIYSALLLLCIDFCVWSRYSDGPEFESRQEQETCFFS